MRLLTKMCTVAGQLVTVVIAMFSHGNAVASPPADAQGDNIATYAQDAVSLLKMNQTYDPTIKYAISCQLVMFERGFFVFRITELSTYKINACDPDLFIATTSASVKAQLDTFKNIDRIIQVGPSVQMMDRNKSNVSHPYLSIGLLNFSQVGTGRVTLFDIFTHLPTWIKWRSRVSSYNPLKVSENTDYLWLPGSTVYAIVTDTDKVFVMTNFVPSSLKISVEQIEVEAKNLYKYLNLPAGWRYESIKLKKILAVKRQSSLGYNSSRLADEYSNSYIFITESIE